MLRTQREKIMFVTVRSLMADLNGLWLRHRLDTYLRQLQSIAVQRENDFQVERILQKQISIIRSELRLGRRVGVMYEPVQLSYQPGSHLKQRHAIAKLEANAGQGARAPHSGRRGRPADCGGDCR